MIDGAETDPVTRPAPVSSHSPRAGKITYDTRPSPFKRALDQSVESYLKTRASGRFAGPVTKLKCACIGASLLLTYVALLTVVEGMLAMFAVMIALGVLQLMLVFNVGHDAAHGSFSPRRSVNVLLRYTWDVGGISSYSWSLRHNVAHHGFTNLIGVDLDIEQGFLLRLNPGETWRPFHRLQHRYAPLIYSLFTFYLATIRDFQILVRKEFGNRRLASHPRRAWVEVCVGKVLYYGYMLAIPAFVTDFSFAALATGWIVMHIVTGTIAMALAAPPHLAVENVLERAPSNGRVPRCFAEHQLLTTADMAPESRLLIAFCGGLNVQVVHHLYPGLSHSHHRVLVPLVRRVASAHGLVYRSRSIGAALRSHYAHLRAMGAEPGAHSQSRTPPATAAPGVCRAASSMARVSASLVSPGSRSAS